MHLPLASARVAQVGEEINVGNKNCWLTQQNFSEITNNNFILIFSYWKKTNILGFHRDILEVTLLVDD